MYCVNATPGQAIAHVWDEAQQLHRDFVENDEKPSIRVTVPALHKVEQKLVGGDEVSFTCLLGCGSECSCSHAQRLLMIRRILSSSEKNPYANVWHGIIIHANAFECPFFISIVVQHFRPKQSAAFLIKKKHRFSRSRTKSK
jgi:hypothetical protein